jgi:hypothetical protein
MLHLCRLYNRMKRCSPLSFNISTNMLRTQILRSSPLLFRPLLATCNESASLRARSLATSAIRYNNLKSGRPDEQVKKGSEGPHRTQAPTVQVAAPVHTSVTSTPMTGDWVLFHPVYTPEELRAVEVCLIPPTYNYYPLTSC